MITPSELKEKVERLANDANQGGLSWYDIARIFHDKAGELFIRAFAVLVRKK